MKRTKLITKLLAFALAAIPVAVTAGEHDHAGHAHAEVEAAVDAATAPAATADAMIVAKQKASYPLTTCPVSGEELGSMGDPVDFVHEGRLVRFCCGMCEGKFLEDPAKVFAKIDAAVIDAQLDSYAMDKCPISGMKLGGMGEPNNHVHGTRLVRFCCEGCLPKFVADPEAALAKIDAALIEAQKADYPQAMCPVTSNLAIDAMGEPFDILYGTRLVRLCCEACVKEFWKNPEKYVAKLETAD